MSAEREGAASHAVTAGSGIPSTIGMPPTIGIPLSVVEGVRSTDSWDDRAIPPVQLPLSNEMSATSLFSGSAGGGMGGAPGALLALAPTFAFIVWRAIQRQNLQIPTGLPTVVLTPPG